MYSRVLLPTDGSETAELATERAINPRHTEFYILFGHTVW